MSNRRRGPVNELVLFPAGTRPVKMSLFSAYVMTRKKLPLYAKPCQWKTVKIFGIKFQYRYHRWGFEKRGDDTRLGSFRFRRWTRKLDREGVKTN